MENYHGAGQATDDSIISRMSFTCRITKVTNTHIKNMLFSHDNICYANASKCYFIRRSPVLVLVCSSCCLFCTAFRVIV